MELLKRKIDAFLASWKQNPQRKPLIVKGARQIGKTLSIQAFGQANYESVIEINFVLQKKFRSIFDNGYEVDTIIKNISLLEPSWKFIPYKTLIFFDELQKCPDCATSLKSFNADPRYDVICSGSLMGIYYEEIESNAVGNKEDYEMHSMDFEEFLWARGYSETQVEHTGAVVIRPQFDDAYPFSEGLAAVMIDEKWGYIDKKGEIKIHMKYDGASLFHEGLAFVYIGGKYAYIDKMGMNVTGFDFDLADGFCDGLAMVFVDGKRFYIDKSGDKVPRSEEPAGDFSEGLAPVSKHNKWGFIDKAGNVVIQHQFDEVTGFSEGLALVVKNEKIGFIDKTGNFVIQLPSNLNYYTGFSDGLACVKIDGKFGFIDKSGKVVIRPQFESEAFFSDGLAYVERDGKEGYIDKSGNWVWSKEKEVYDYPVDEDVDEEIDESPAKEK